MTHRKRWRSSSAKCCCFCMWQQEPQQPFCDHERVSARQNQYAEGCREERSKQLWSLRMSLSYWNNYPETASLQESLSEKTAHLQFKTVEPEFPVTHSWRHPIWFKITDEWIKTKWKKMHWENYPIVPVGSFESAQSRLLFQAKVELYIIYPLRTLGLFLFFSTYRMLYFLDNW